MEQTASDLSRSLYADYGAFGMMFLINVATSYILFRYFSEEVRTCREQRDASDRDWRTRYDTLLERMLAQVVSLSSTMERLTDRIERK
jgi:hypothetical protein